AVITMILGAVILMLCGVGIVRLGIVPDSDVAVRLVAWFLAASLYVVFWLGLATLGSVVFRRAATAALVVIAIWLVLTFFGNQTISTVHSAIRPVPSSPTANEVLANAQMITDLRRLNPIMLFQQSTQ